MSELRMVNVTTKNIINLAESVGLSVSDETIDDDFLETEYTICENFILIDEDSKEEVNVGVACYASEYKEEGAWEL